jgi:hypothetical protein
MRWIAGAEMPEEVQILPNAHKAYSANEKNEQILPY